MPDAMKMYMKKDNLQIKKLLQRAPRAAAAAILSAALCAFVLTGVLGVGLETALLLAVMLLCAAVSAAAELFSLANSVLIGSCAVFILGGGALFFLPVGEGSIYGALTAGADIAPARVLPIALLLCGALCAALCLLNRSFVMRCIIAGSLLTVLFVFIWLRLTLLTVPAILIVAYILLVLCQICAQRVACAEGSPRDMWFVMFSLLTAVLIFVLPFPGTRIQWEKLFVIKPTEQLEQLGETLDIEKIADSSQSGYSEDASSLGSWLELNSKVCLQVIFSDNLHSDRLTGSVYDRYTGTGWVSTVESDGTAYGAAPAVSHTDVQSVSDSDLYGAAYIFDISETSASDAGIETVFYPPYSYSVVSYRSVEITMQDGRRLTFDQSNGPEYNAYYYKRPCECELSTGELERYLSIPDELPERVRELAVTAAGECTDDRSKADALMLILADCEYETRVRNVPKGRDFVDYFLFDSHKGYCAYYASAMAVLARCVGIPSRYVQGYRIGSCENQIVTVASDNAHAWAELYIDGRWIIYDPVMSPAQDAAGGNITDTDDTEMQRDNSALRRTLLYSYAVTAAAAVVFITFMPFFRRIPWYIRLKRKYGKYSGYRTILHCAKLLWVLSACGVRRAETETLTEFGARICREYDWIDDTMGEQLSRFFAQTGRALYASDCAEDCMQEDIASAVRRAYTGKFGLAKYLRVYRSASA